MTFQIEWHKHARKRLQKLPDEIVHRILSKTREAAEDPFRYLEHFEGERVYKLRVGDYRLLIDVDFKSSRLLVQHFDHRKRIYGRL